MVRKSMVLGILLLTIIALVLLAHNFLGYSLFGATLLVVGAMAAQWIATYTLEAFDDEKS